MKTKNTINNFNKASWAFAFLIVEVKSK